jgi:hypothetical protein
MAVRDGEGWLAAALNSLWAQSMADFELVVVDDASSDGTAAILDSQSDGRLHRLRNDRPLGLAASLNRALDHARAPLVARHDADDLSRPDRMARQTAMFDVDPSLALVGSAYRVIDAAGEVNAICRHPSHPWAIRWQMLFHNAFCHSSVMARRDALERAGRYDETLEAAQDYDLWARVMVEGGVANVDDTLVDWRQHASAVSSTRAARQQAIADAISARQLAALPGLPAISRETVSEMRRCYYRLPPPCRPGHLDICCAFLAAVDAFAALPGVPRPLCRQLRRQWRARTARVVANLPAGSLATATLGALARTVPLGLAEGLARRMVGRLGTP